MPKIQCSWCEQDCDLNADGFHLVQIAFGLEQERFCFCSDTCYEAFRKMYPSRVHRNCYEHSCVDCEYCHKNFPDEVESLRSLMSNSSGEQ